MDQVHVIRHKVLVEGRSQRAVARELGVSRLTVKKYLSQAAPARHEAQPRPLPVSEAVGPRIATLLEESPRWTTAKQRLTATRLHQLLRAEGDAVGVPVVKEAVAEWKRQQREPLIPLTYRPGEFYGKRRVMVTMRPGGGIPRRLVGLVAIGPAHNGYKASSQASRSLGGRRDERGGTVGEPAAVRASRFISKSLCT